MSKGQQKGRNDTMGMAASQARLLMLTARIHDVEWEAQCIQSAKLQLSTQEDQVYKEYLEALDATTMTVKDWQGNPITATFNTLCGRNHVDSMNNYALKDSQGALIVSDEVADAYEEYQKKHEGEEDNAYMFALSVLGYDNDDLNLAMSASAVYNAHKGESSNAIKEMKSIYEEMAKTLDCSVEEIIEVGDVGRLTEYWNLDDDEKAKLKAQENRLIDIAYTSFKDEFLSKAIGKELDKDSNEYKQMTSDIEYYMSVYNQIKASNGYTRISDYNGFHGDAANDSEWLQNMVKCGKITIYTVGKDANGQTELRGTGVATDTYLEYTTTSSIDKSKLAKVEAEYEHKTKEIQRKDKKYDLSLNKLETERKALTTQYDAVKKVIEDNINRTYGIFNS